LHLCRQIARPQEKPTQLRASGFEDTLPPVTDGLDMRSRYEQALAEVEEMKRTLREHAQHVAAREKELEALRLEVAGRQGRRRAPAPAGPDRSKELSDALAKAEKREREAVQELALAKAERERLDEREQAIRKVERELAGLRVQLQEERARLGGEAQGEPEPSREADSEGDPPPPTPLPQPPAEPDLDPAATAKRQRSSMLADPQLRKQR
jgi:F0F1-type ATP synthase membrane subunit b/b'